MLHVYIFSHLSILTNAFAYIREGLNHRCFGVESHVFRGGKPWVSWRKAMCFVAKQSFVCVRAATCSCPRSYLFVPAQLPVRVLVATSLNLHSDILVVLRLRTFKVASAHSRVASAHSRNHMYMPPSVWPFSFLHFFIMPFISPYLFFRPPFIRHSVIFPNKVVKYK